MQKREYCVLSIFGALLALTGIVKYVFKTQYYTLMMPYQNAQIPEAADKLLKQINGCEFIAERAFSVLLIAFLLYLGWKTAYGVFGLRKILPAMFAVLSIPALLAFLTWRQQGISPTQQWHFAFTVGWVALMMVYRFAWKRTQGRIPESVLLSNRPGKRQIGFFSTFSILLMLTRLIEGINYHSFVSIGNKIDQVQKEDRALADQLYQQIEILSQLSNKVSFIFQVLSILFLLYIGWEIAYGLLSLKYIIIGIFGAFVLSSLVQFAFQPKNWTIWIFFSQDIIHAAVWIVVMKTYHIISEKMKTRASMAESPVT
jgi:hypothetical protein